VKHKELSKLLYYKNVLLIGGSGEYEMSDCEPYVVSVNSHFDSIDCRVSAVYYASIDEKAVTPPVDLDYLCTPRDQKHWNFLERYCEECRIPIVPYLAQQYLGRNPYGLDLEWCNTFQKLYSFKPLTGLIAIYHLLSFPIRSLHVTGMTLYRKDEHLPAKVDAHWIEPQQRYLKDLVKSDARVTYDNPLMEALALPVESESKKIVSPQQLRERMREVAESSGLDPDSPHCPAERQEKKHAFIKIPWKNRMPSLHAPEGKS
jgi:hypothetical protein